MDLKMALQELLQDGEGELGDRHEIYLRLRQIIEGLKAQGMPVPDDLVRLEHSLEQEFADDAAGQRQPEP